jgi:hypothetical protein
VLSVRASGLLDPGLGPEAEPRWIARDGARERFGVSGDRSPVAAFAEAVVHDQAEDSVCRGHHRNRDQKPWPDHADLADATRRPHVGEEFVEYVGKVISVFWAHE